MADRQIGLMVATRRLFVEPFEESVADTLLGADVVLLDASDPLRSILTAESSRGGPKAVVIAPPSVGRTGGETAMPNDVSHVAPVDAARLLSTLLDQSGPEKA